MCIAPFCLQKGHKAPSLIKNEDKIPLLSGVFLRLWHQPAGAVTAHQQKEIVGAELGQNTSSVPCGRCYFYYYYYFHNER